MSPRLLSLNVGRAEHSDHSGADTGLTGHRKKPVASCAVRAPGPRRGGAGSGLVGDFIGDQRHHGGDHQAVYAYAREDLDRWAERLDTELPDGAFGENLTTTGIEVNQALIGEVWRVGEVELEVRCARIPCRTFAGEIGVPRWVKEFTKAARPGPYLSVRRPGTLHRQDPIEVIHRPEHRVTVELWFRALTTSPELLVELLPACDALPEETLHRIDAWQLRNQQPLPGR